MGSYWAENFPFIKDVYDGRVNKLENNMEACDQSVIEVFADKIYPLKEFKTIKENFLKIAKSVEDKEIHGWLEKTSEIMEHGMDQKTKELHFDKINKILNRLEMMLPKVRQTKTDVDSLWRAYQFTDELTPHMEWLNDKSEAINKPLSSDSAEETEKLIERIENVVGQLDKKKKAFLGMLQQATKLISNPKIPEFLGREVKKARAMWDETNRLAQQHLSKLEFNKESWGKYDEQKNALGEAILNGERELQAIVEIYDIERGIEDHKARVLVSVDVRKQIEDAYKTFNGTKTSVQELCTEDVKSLIDEEVLDILKKSAINDKIDSRLNEIDEFHKNLKEYLNVLAELEDWINTGRNKMTELLNPTKEVSDQDKVVMTMQLMEDIATEIEKYEKHNNQWNVNLAPIVATPESTIIAARMAEVFGKLNELSDEANKEAEQYGDDVKNLAEVMKCNNKFEPWIIENEYIVQNSKIDLGKTIEDANSKKSEIVDWKIQSEEMKATIDRGNAAAQLMGSHDNADLVYAAFVQRWLIVHKTITEWIPQVEAYIELWEKQEIIADKIQVVILDPKTNLGINDLEALFSELKNLMLQKQKIMQEINSTTKKAE